jgi:beta-glucosidase
MNSGIEQAARAPEGRDQDARHDMWPYRNRELPVADRVADLVSRLSLEELAGLLFHPVLEMGPQGSLLEGEGRYSTTGSTELVLGKLISHVNVHALGTPQESARWTNALQRLASSTPHGIPMTISTDPRHGFVENSEVSFTAGSFSAWPEPLGLAAIGDEELVRRFARIARHEYRAVGISAALHPSVDLATEPRWGRQIGTFGQSVALATRLVAAYLDGFQGRALTASSVACTTKHFPGGGPQKDGEDPHFAYGREQVYPGGRFEEHLAPFRAAIEQGTSGIMPYYGLPVGLTRGGQPIDEVGFAFNRRIITELLREELGFTGVILSDWQIIRDRVVGGERLVNRGWGTEHLSDAERMLLALEAGIDQFGGEQATDLLIDLVRSGRVSRDRIEDSARRILTVKFSLGLFDDPIVDETHAMDVLSDSRSRAEGHSAQARSVTVLTNENERGRVLPLAPGRRLHAEGIAENVLAGYGTVVEHPAEAEVVIVRLDAPWDRRNDLPMEHSFRAGSLEFPPGLVWRLRRLADHARLVVVVHLDRPAILTPFLEFAAAVVGVYGASDEALLDALSGRIPPEGRLPFDIPRSTAAVLASRPDTAGDTPDALFRAGHGLPLDLTPHTHPALNAPPHT